MSELRHVGLMVKNLEESLKSYQKLGFKEIERGEFKTVKMENKYGQKIELIEGGYKDHISVNWFSDEWDNLFEVVKEK